MKKKKDSHGLSKEELAQELTRLAGRIADGALSLEKDEIPIPEELSLEWIVREKNGKFTLDLSVKGFRRHSDSASSKGKRSSRKRRPYEVKRLKKAIAGHWKEIRHSLRIRQSMPPRGKCLSLLDRYGDFAEPAWENRWATCKEMITRLYGLAEKGDYEAANRLSDEIEMLMKACHKAYK